MTFIFTEKLKMICKRDIVLFQIATTKNCDAVTVIGGTKVSDKSPLSLSSWTMIIQEVSPEVLSSQSLKKKYQSFSCSSRKVPSDIGVFRLVLRDMCFSVHNSLHFDLGITSIELRSLGGFNLSTLRERNFTSSFSFLSF